MHDFDYVTYSKGWFSRTRDASAGDTGFLTEQVSDLNKIYSERGTAGFLLSANVITVRLGRPSRMGMRAVKVKRVIEGGARSPGPTVDEKGLYHGVKEILVLTCQPQRGQAHHNLHHDFWESIEFFKLDKEVTDSQPADEVKAIMEKISQSTLAAGTYKVFSRVGGNINSMIIKDYLSGKKTLGLD